jgi:ATP-dependent helicase/nuclease subunit B
MVTDLSNLAKEVGVKRLKDVCLDRKIVALPASESVGGELVHLEKQIFRFPVVPYTAPLSTPASISLTEASSIAAEVQQACLKIKELTLEHGYKYGEIAIITGDMKSYAPYLERGMQKYAIPLYLDRTSGIEFNPFSEFIRSALAVVSQNYSYASVFRFLRSGFTDIASDEIDLLENYVLACGIRGKKQWHEPFKRRMQ